MLLGWRGGGRESTVVGVKEEEHAKSTGRTNLVRTYDHQKKVRTCDMHRDRSWAHDGMPHSSTRGRWGVGEAAKAKPSTCDASRPGTDPWDGDMVFLRVEKSHCIWPWACAPESEIGCPLHWRTAKACLASLAQRTLFRSTGDAGPALDSRASARSLPGRGSGLSVEEQWRDWVWQGSAGVRRARRCRDSSGAGHWLLAAFARSRKGRRPGGVRPQAGGGDDQCYQPAWVCDAIAMGAVGGGS